MLTVLRILAPPSQIDDLKRVIGTIDARSARGEVEWRAPRGDGYYVTIFDGSSWSDHASGILRFVEDNREALTLARAAGATLTFDTAVDREDVDGVSMLEAWFREELVEAVASISGELVVSMYILGPDPNVPGWVYRTFSAFARLSGRVSDAAADAREIARRARRPQR